MVYIKIILLKIARYFAVMIGNIIRFFKGNKHIDLKEIKKIIFNRKDRIGDAVITKPFIILFSKYVKEELKLDIEIEVECSKYNEFVFMEGDGEKYYKLKSENAEILGYGKGPVELIKFFFKSIGNNIKLKSKNKEKCNTVYIDLIGNHNHILEKLSEGNYYFIGPNLFFNNYLLDYSLISNYVSGNNDNLIESYIKLIKGCFKLDNFQNYINRNIEYFFQDYNHLKNKKGILVFIGNKEFRNLAIETRNKIIINLGLKHSDEEVYVLDDNLNILYQKLLSYSDYPKNIKFLENKFHLDELRNFAKNFKLIIGIDGGGFNYIRTCTDSLEIFTLANSKVWRIFTGKENYKSERLFNNRVFNYTQIGEKKFGYIYKKSPILPSYDTKIPQKFFNNILNNLNLSFNK